MIEQLRGVHEIANDTIINWKMRIAEIEETMTRPTTPVHRDRRDLLNVFGDLSKPIFGTATLSGRKGSKMSPTAQSRGTRSMLASKWFRSVATMSRVFGSCESRLSELERIAEAAGCSNVSLQLRQDEETDLASFRRGAEQWVKANKAHT